MPRISDGNRHQIEFQGQGNHEYRFRISGYEQDLHGKLVIGMWEKCEEVDARQSYCRFHFRVGANTSFQTFNV